MNTEREKLKPCPFCGGEAVVHTSFDSSYLICCENPNCQAQGRLSGKLEKAISAWNTRANGDQWISVDDRLPWFHELVLVLDGCEYYIARYTNNCFYLNGIIDEGHISNVDFWMPLPEPPEAK